MKQSCQTLEEKLTDKEELFTKRKINTVNFIEFLLNLMFFLVEICLSDTERDARQRIKSLETELFQKTKECEEQLRSMKELEIKYLGQESHLKTVNDKSKELFQRIEILTSTEHELREKVHTSEMEFSEKLHSKEKELADKINEITKQMNETRIQNECDKRELEEKLNLSQDELTMTRITRSNHDSNTTNNKTINLNRSQILQEEVESLRCVLELKQSEISELRKVNQECVENTEQLEVQNIRLSTTETRLQMQLQETLMKLQGKQDDEK